MVHTQAQMMSIQAILSSTYHMSMSCLTSLLYGESLLAVRQDGAIYMPPEHSQVSNGLKKAALVKVDC